MSSKLGARRVDAQLAVSRYVAQHVDGTSSVVLSGVRSTAGRVTAAQRTPVVLVAQRLSPEKHTDVAIRAFAESGLAARGWRLAVAGRGTLLGELQELARRLGTGHAVDFLGYRTDVLDLMRESSILLAPRVDEAFGLSVVEAIEVQPDVPARIIVNERTGTIVATSRIRIAPCAVSHGELTISIANTDEVSQPNAFSQTGNTATTTRTDTNVQEKKAHFVTLQEMPTIEKVAAGLNAIGVTPRDMMAIFQAMKQAGALQADLIIL